MKDYVYEILKLIVKDEYINTKVIANKQEVSLRTAKYRIAEAKNYALKYDCELRYSYEQGYYFLKRERLIIELLLNDLMNLQVGITTYNQRRLYILGTLLCNENTSIQNLINQTYSQEVTIKKDLHFLQSELNHGNLKLKINGSNVTLIADFLEKSKVFINFVLEESQVAVDHNSFNLRVFFYENISSELYEKLQVKFMNSKYNVANDYTRFQIFWYLYYIAIIRRINFSNNNVSLQKLLKQNLSPEELKILEELIIAIGYEDSGSFSRDSHATNFFNKLEREYNLQISYDSLSYQNIIFKIKQLSLQLSYGINFKYRKTKRIIRLYPYSFSIAQQLLNYVGLKEIKSRDAVAYITTDIQSLLFNSKYSKSILIVASTVNDIIKYYISWIEYQYTKNIKIIVVSPKAAKQKVLYHQQEIKLIINFEVLKINSQVPELKLSPIISKQNINQIDQMLKRESGNLLFMKNFLHQRYLKVFLFQPTFSDILKQAAIKWEKEKVITDAISFINECEKREIVGTTYIGYETMIVHPLDYCANENMLYITTVHNKINVQGNEVSLFIICAFKKSIDFEISRLFEILTKMVEQEKYRTKITNSESEMELLININSVLEKL